MQKSQRKKLLIGGLILFGLGFICFVIISFSFFRNLVVFIGPTERGLVISPYHPAGYREEVLTPGNHFIYPGERVEIYNVWNQTYTISEPDFIEASTLDGETVLVEASATYVLDTEKIVEIHINWQNRYENELVRPSLRRTTRSAISKFIYSEIDGQSSQLEESIYETLETELNKNFLTLLDFKIIFIQISK